MHQRSTCKRNPISNSSASQRGLWAQIYGERSGFHANKGRAGQLPAWLARYGGVSSAQSRANERPSRVCAVVISVLSCGSRCQGPPALRDLQRLLITSPAIAPELRRRDRSVRVRAYVRAPFGVLFGSETRMWPNCSGVRSETGEPSVVCPDGLELW